MISITKKVGEWKVGETTEVVEATDALEQHFADRIADEMATRLASLNPVTVSVRLDIKCSVKGTAEKAKADFEKHDGGGVNQ